MDYYSGKWKIQASGGSLLKWLDSYWTCWFQSVRSCGAISFKFQPSSGVKLLLYADDIKLLLMVRSERDAIILQGELERLLQWSVSNSLPINYNICKVISFCKGDYCFYAHYKLAKIDLERVEHIRDLGEIMDKSLSFNEQLQVVVKNCLRIFSFIRNVTIDFNYPQTIAYLHKTLLLPILTYCLPIWCPKTETSLKELISIEHKYLRYAISKTSSPMHFFDHDYTQIRNVLGLKSLRSLILEIDYLVAYKISKHLYNFSEVNVLFKRRVFSHNLRKIRELENKKAVPNYISKSTPFRLRDSWNLMENNETKNVYK